MTYTATNFAQGVGERDQACDYYLGVISSSKGDDKVYMVPVGAPY